MILNTKYANIREIVNKKLEEFIIALDEIKIYDKEKNKKFHIIERDLCLNKFVSPEDKIGENKIYISTSQILTKILLGKK
jgi:hypothetical protein